jgi:hypothetical protein
MISLSPPHCEVGALYSPQPLEKENTVGTGAKIAIGCGIVVLAGGVIAIVGLGAGAYWVKGKTEKFASDIRGKTDEIRKYEQEANRNPFSPPADGVIDEARFLKFMDVRKGIYTVYEQHKAELDDLSKRGKDKKPASLGDVMEGVGAIGRLTSDLRVAQVKGLAQAGMSENEYRFIQRAVYHSAWASQAQKESGMQPADMVEQAMKQASAASQEALQKAQQAGISLPPQPSAEDMKKTEDAMKELTAQAGGLRVPQANLDLFRKHEEEIKKYTMNDLGFLGLF